MRLQRAEPLDFECHDLFCVNRLLACDRQRATDHLLQIVDVVDEDAVEIVHPRSTSRGTAISMKNIGRLRRLAMNCSPCSLRKIACGAPVEVMTMSASSAVA